MHFLTQLNQTLSAQSLDFFAGAQMVYHCHHFNLFLDQTVADALGEAASFDVRFEAARSATSPFLHTLIAASSAETPAEKLALAGQIFGAMGHGSLDFDADKAGGKVTGSFLHYGFAWKEKYSQIARRHHPVDAFATGFSAAAVEVAYGLAPLSMGGKETECIACRDPQCTIELAPSSPQEPRPKVGLDACRETSGAPLTGLYEEQILAIEAGLRGFLSGVKGDENGLVQAFGVFVTRHFTNYYNQITYDTYTQVKSRSPAMAKLVDALFVESGHVCVFNTFAGILYSPEWDGMVGRVKGDLEEVVTGCFAIARALGFGRWCIHELTPDRLVLRSSSDYASPYYNTRHGQSEGSVNFFVRGAAVGIMRIWDAIDWQNRPNLDKDLYNSLFKGSATVWTCEQPKALTLGDAYNEIVVTRQSNTP